MSKKTPPRLTPDELVAYLKRTSQPTILVEGIDDKMVYRYLESILEDINIDCLDCGGRPGLLKVYDRRNEFPDKPVIFLADKDMWLFTGIPEEYDEDILFTRGYSIENDLYIKDVFEALLDCNEKISFDLVIKSLSRWHAFHVNQFQEAGSCNNSYHLNEIIPLTESSLCPKHLAKIGYVEPSNELVQSIYSSYYSLVRGKNLFEGLLRFLSSNCRSSRYSKANLLEMGSRLQNSCIHKLCSDIRNAYSKCASA